MSMKGAVIMAKVMKSYRIEQFTLNRLSWLSHDLDLSDTSVVELAITELYMKRYYDRCFQDGSITSSRIQALAADYEYTPDQIIEIAVDRLYKDRIDEKEKDMP